MPLKSKLKMLYVRMDGFTIQPKGWIGSQLDMRMDGFMLRCKLIHLPVDPARMDGFAESQV